jgi:ubiquinone/menaquinone biosynthesis C-methylase UbiE|eukprot:CAMPEP_0174288602 /NCGR_PEP_ID=MMETSP0809-20121228/21526_1 /TAXON_ID=73025 ORGANISM="Eutreptiella gymnastica-like, Strain CCMP1594" /NCGR_SAMPLE_ID=MMETSP0809 /ASSEMBLY_ACC=CAM_ASM_000658 /LENGTH=527 /DNA_ID=CAMNT_0015385951 /DNA_START=37 /DNA_END=1620 /DNA_ORIENTATION=-
MEPLLPTTAPTSLCESTPVSATSTSSRYFPSSVSVIAASVASGVALALIVSSFVQPQPSMLSATVTGGAPASVVRGFVQTPSGAALGHQYQTVQQRAEVPYSSTVAAPAPSVAAASAFNGASWTSIVNNAASFLLLPFAAGALIAWLTSRKNNLRQWQMATVNAEEVDPKPDVQDVEADVQEAPAPAPEDEMAPVDEAFMSMEPRLCCPTCMKPLMGSFCASCSLEYEDTGVYLNLTPASGRPIKAGWEAEPDAEEGPLMQIPGVKDALPFIEQIEKAVPRPAGAPRLSKVIQGGYQGDKGAWGTDTFENPIVSSIYERGWRQSFARAGFPGPDEEFAQALEWMLPVAKGKAVLDASCGSGLFTRRFLTCGEFSKVFALDFSENMLKQTRQGIDKEPELQQKAVELDLELVRADIARLPFASESLSAVHAGAAIHCWPQPSLAMSEIARVLKPGGRAVLSTFMVPGQDVPFLNESTRAALVTPVIQQNMKYWEESELKDLCASVGLVNFVADKRRDYIMFMVMKAEY